MKLNLGSGRFPLDGFVNIDASSEWGPDLERDVCTGLPFDGDSIEAVTISHMLMYLSLAEWRALFKEVYRVLTPTGFVRITEDETVQLNGSARYGGQPNAVSLTSFSIVASDLRWAGFESVTEVAPHETLSGDESLIQRWHGDPPDVFHVEGQKQ